MINEVMRIEGEIIVISSTDKNFMVPVGGSLVYSNNKKIVKGISEIYPGRACMQPVLDLFITLLSMGKIKLKELLNDRKVLREKVIRELEEYA